ncbi:MAG: helix-turn-helix transcriptional regulator [Bacteroidota bacterium]
MGVIIEEQNLTERTLQRMFKKFVGITPTQFRRICQFQQSFGQLRGGHFSKVSDVAFDNHFSDQSHFIRSFKEFTDTTPNDYLKKGLTRNGQ